MEVMLFGPWSSSVRIWSTSNKNHHFDSESGPLVRLLVTEPVLGQTQPLRLAGTDDRLAGIRRPTRWHRPSRESDRQRGDSFKLATEIFFFSLSNSPCPLGRARGRGLILHDIISAGRTRGFVQILRSLTLAQAHLCSSLVNLEPLPSP